MQEESNEVKFGLFFVYHDHLSSEDLEYEIYNIQ